MKVFILIYLTVVSIEHDHGCENIWHRVGSRSIRHPCPFLTAPFLLGPSPAPLPHPESQEMVTGAFTLAKCFCHKDLLAEFSLPCHPPTELHQGGTARAVPQQPGRPAQAWPSSPPAWAPAVPPHTSAAECWHTGTVSQMFEFC